MFRRKNCKHSHPRRQRGRGHRHRGITSRIDVYRGSGCVLINFFRMDISMMHEWMLLFVTCISLRGIQHTKQKTMVDDSLVHCQAYICAAHALNLSLARGSMYWSAFGGEHTSTCLCSGICAQSECAQCGTRIDVLEDGEHTTDVNMFVRLTCLCSGMCAQSESECRTRRRRRRDRKKIAY